MFAGFTCKDFYVPSFEPQISFHHNYLIGYLIDYLMFYVIIISSEVFELLLGLLGCRMIYIVEHTLGLQRYYVRDLMENVVNPN